MPEAPCKAIRIDDFIEINGRSLEVTSTTIAGVETLILRSGGSELRFVCAAECDSWPYPDDASIRSRIRWLAAGDVKWVQQCTYSLKDDHSVYCQVHIPTPFSPDLRGYWITLPLHKKGGDWTIDLAQHVGLDPNIYWWDQEKSGSWSRNAMLFEKLGLQPKKYALVDFLKWSGQAINHDVVKSRHRLVSDLDPNESTVPLLLLLDHPDLAFIPVIEKRGKTGTYEAMFHYSLDATEKYSSTLLLSALTGSNELVQRQPFNLIHQGPAAMYCVVDQTGTHPRRNRFLLEWRGLEGQHDTNGELTLRNVWAVIARHYAVGLATTRARNSLTIFPGDVEFTADAKSPWNFRFLVERTFGQQGVDWAVRLVEVYPQAVPEIKLAFAGASDRSGNAITRSMRLAPSKALLLGEAGEQLDADGQIGLREKTPLVRFESVECKDASSELVVGGALLRLGKINKLTLEVASLSPLSTYPQAPVEASVSLEFAGTLLRPASQDPEIGFETLSAWQNRERPISIDLADSQQSVVVEFVESARRQQSRLLRIGVRAQKDGSREPLDVVVIDPEPFLVARTTVDGGAVVAKDDLLAEYTDDSELPAEWAISNPTGAVALTLPPQAIGEEAIKGLLQYPATARPLPSTTELFDFRLSPAAQLAIDLSDIDTARVTAPWATRRILSHRLGVVGVKLDRATFELLYGLTTEISTKGLRLAETDAFVGRVPFSDDLLALLREFQLDSNDVNEYRKLAKEYSSHVASWIGGLFRRPAQLAVFRDFTDRTRLTIAEDIEFTQRKTRQTANPFQLDQLASKDTPADNREPLRGGLDFAFESLNVATEFWQRTSSKVGSVSGLRFGTLGGSGSQQAAFSNGKTLVISDTTDGRINSVTLIRVGRIAMLWNHARHVIVYERTTRTAPRYQKRGVKAADQPTEFEGLAALRKVKEYIEITQAKRQFPDSSTWLPINGPLLASSFDTLVIPVKSSWGHDIKDGWITALRGPLDPAEDRFYPFPKIYLQFARAEAKGEGHVNQQVADPSLVFFFTSTNPTDGGDTDVWPAWPDVDFPIVGKPAPPPAAATPRLGNAMQPDAAGHDFGQRRFTIDLLPAEEAINLMHGRLVGGVEARLRNISLARGMPDLKKLAPERHDLARQVGDPQNAINEGLTELIGRLRELKAAAPGQPVDAATLARAKVMMVDLQAQASELDKVTNVQPELDWGKRQRANLDSFAGGNKFYVSSDAKRPGLWQQQLAGVIDGIGNFKEANVEDARHRVLDGLEHACRQIEDRLDGVPFVFDQALQIVERLIEQAETRVAEVARAESARFIAAVDAAEAIARASQHVLPGPVRDQIQAALALAPAAALRLADEALQWLRGGLHEWFGAVPGGSVQALQPFLDDLGDWIVAVEEWEATCEEFLDAQDFDWQSLRDLADGLDASPAIFGFARGWAAERRDAAMAGFDGARSAAKDALHKRCEDLSALIRKWNLADLKNALPALNDFLQRAQDQLGDIRTAAQKTFDDLMQQAEWKDVVGSVGAFKDYVDDVKKHLSEIQTQLQNSAGAAVEGLLKNVGDLADPVVSSLGTIANQAEAAVAREVGQLPDWRAAVQGLESGALELTRAFATGPVTDTMSATRDYLGYYYDAAKQALDVTRSSAIFNRLAESTLNSLSAAMPFDRLRDRLLPQLNNFDINKLLPDFAGLKLEHLFKDLKVLPTNPLDEYEWMRITHGFDKDRVTAWAEVNVDKVFDDDPALFTLSPLKLTLQRPRFVATSRLEIGGDGAKTQATRGALTADWILKLSDKPILTMRKATLKYDSRGGFDFDMDVDNVALDETLRFVTDAVKALRPNDSGMSIAPILPGGISATIDLPLPDIGTGAFTLTGITLSTHFDLLFAPKFEVRTGLWLSKPDRPFGLAILFLGGGGWFGVDVSYQPPDKFTTRVSIGVSAGAFVALNFGVAAGSAGLLFTVGLDFYSTSEPGGKSSTAISTGILMWGELSICGIASAYIRLVMRVTQEDGEMHGYGVIEVSIEICWCFTLKVSSPIAMPFKGGSHGSLSAAAADVSPDAAIKKALDAHFANLDI